jgi:hypothetical protein
VGSGIEIVDRGYLIGGTIWSFGAGEADAGLMIIDDKGNFKWGRTIGGEKGEGINWDGVRIAGDGGFIFGDKTASFDSQGGGAFFGVKLRPNGALEWSTMLDGPGEDVGWAMNEIQGGFIAGGKINLPPNGGDVLFTKFDEQGNTLWARSFGGEGLDEIEEIKQIGDGFVMTGVTRLIDPAGDILVAKVDAEGFLESDASIIKTLEPRLASSIAPTVSEFNPRVEDVSDRLLVMSVEPHTTQPDVQVHRIE